MGAGVLTLAFFLLDPSDMQVRPGPEAEYGSNPKGKDDKVSFLRRELCISPFLDEAASCRQAEGCIVIRLLFQ